MYRSTNGIMEIQKNIMNTSQIVIKVISVKVFLCISVCVCALRVIIQRQCQQVHC